MLTRKDLIEGLGATAVLVALGGAGRALAVVDAGDASSAADATGSADTSGAVDAVGGNHGLLRPPGALDEARFAGACIRCDRCRSICPTNTIGVATIEDGLVNVRTPKLDFHLGYCNECGGEYRCARVCPTGALGAFEPLATEPGIGRAVIDTSRCLTYGISGGCSAKCIDICPTDALRIDDAGRLTLCDELCWGCGACEYVCPSNSYGAYAGSTLRGINVAGVWR